MSNDKKMGDSKRMRKLSLSYIRDTLVRKTSRGFGDGSTSTPGRSAPSEDQGTLQTAALDLAGAPCPQNQQSLNGKYLVVGVEEMAKEAF